MPHPLHRIDFFEVNQSYAVEGAGFCQPARLCQQVFRDQRKGREVMALRGERRDRNFVLFQILSSFRASNSCIPPFPRA